MLFGPATLGLRVIYLAVYFSSFFAAVAVSAILRKPGAVGGVRGSLVLLSFTAMLGLWGLRSAPVHLYDPRVPLESAGEHSARWRLAKDFFERHVVLDNYSKFLTDDPYVISLALPWEQWSKATSIADKRAKVEASTLVVSFNGLNTTTYVAQVGDPLHLENDFDIQGFRSYVDAAKGRIYDNTLQRFWQ
jgi:hypothetical protein